MKCKTVIFNVVLLWGLFILPVPAIPQEEAPSSSPANVEGLALSRAVICEGVSENAPVNSGVVFPISIGQIVCFTSFDTVPAKMVVFHNWYHREELVTGFRLTLKPPRWAARSSIHLRETDKGPWRVEVTGDQGQVIRTLRFSLTD